MARTECVAQFASWQRHSICHKATLIGDHPFGDTETKLRVSHLPN